MKKLNLNLRHWKLIFLSILLTMVLTLQFSFGQDVIIKNDKTEINSKVIEIEQDVVKYRLSSGGPLRNIPKSEVSVIIYENGAWETFELPKNLPQENSVSNQELSEVSISSTSLGEFNLGFKAGVFVPYDEDFSEIYGPGFMPSITLGYWNNEAGVELECRAYVKDGDPYIFGAVDDATATFSMLPITINGYFRNYGGNSVSTYWGFGLGPCFIHEELSISNSYASASDEWNIIAFEVHGTAGIRAASLLFEVTFSSVTHEDLEKTNLGGIVFSFGAFF